MVGDERMVSPQHAASHWSTSEPHELHLFSGRGSRRCEPELRWLNQISNQRMRRSLSWCRKAPFKITSEDVPTSAALFADDNGQVKTKRWGLITPLLWWPWVQKVGLSLGWGLESQAVPWESSRSGKTQGRTGASWRDTFCLVGQNDQKVSEIITSSHPLKLRSNSEVLWIVPEDLC